MTRAGALPQLVRCLGARSRPTQELAMQLLCRLAVCEETEEEVLAAGALPLLLPLISSRSAPLMLGAILLVGNIAATRKVVARDAVQHLIAAVTATKCEMTLEAVAAALRNVAQYADSALVFKGAAGTLLPALASQLERSDARPKEDAAVLMLWLSEVEANHKKIAGLGGIQLLAAISCSGSSTHEARSAALGSLVNLALTESLHGSICDTVLPLIAQLGADQDHPELIAKIGDLLTNLSSSVGGISRVLRSRLVPFIINLLKRDPATLTATVDEASDNGWLSARTSCTCALRNIGVLESGAFAILKSGGIEPLVLMLCQANDAAVNSDVNSRLRRAVSAALCNLSLRSHLVAPLVAADALPALTTSLALEGDSPNKLHQRTVSILKSAAVPAAAPTSSLKTAANAPAAALAASAEAVAAPMVALAAVPMPEPVMDSVAAPMAAPAAVPMPASIVEPVAAPMASPAAVPAPAPVVEPVAAPMAASLVVSLVAAPAEASAPTARAAVPRGHARVAGSSGSGIRNGNSGDSLRRGA